MQAMETWSDGELVKRMAAGGEDAFTALYRRHQGRVFRFALHMSGSAGIAEEVTQEVFVSLMRAPKRYDARRGALIAFLLGVARNHVRRCVVREGLYVEDDGALLEVAGEDDALGDLTKQETLAALRKAILSLPDVYREAVVLCELEEMDYNAAAAVLGCPVGTVRSRLHRARGLLVEKMRMHGGCRP